MPENRELLLQHAEDEQVWRVLERGCDRKAVMNVLGISRRPTFYTTFRHVCTLPRQNLMAMEALCRVSTCRSRRPSVHGYSIRFCFQRLTIHPGAHDLRRRRETSVRDVSLHREPEPAESGPDDVCDQVADTEVPAGELSLEEFDPDPVEQDGH